MRLFCRSQTYSRPSFDKVGAVHGVAELLRGRRARGYTARGSCRPACCRTRPSSASAHRYRRRGPQRACSGSRRQCTPRSPSGRPRSSRRGRSSRIVAAPVVGGVALRIVRTLADSGSPYCAMNLPSRVNFSTCESPGHCRRPRRCPCDRRDAVVGRRPVVALARAAPAAHKVAGRVELEHRRRSDAALARRRLQLGALLRCCSASPNCDG